MEIVGEIIILIGIVGGIAAGVWWDYWVYVARGLKARYLRQQRARRSPIPHPTIPSPPILPQPVLVRPIATVLQPRPESRMPSQVVSRPAKQYGAAAALTANERAFFVELRSAIGERFHICPKMRLADLVSIRPGAGYYKAFNPVAQKHIDFVLMEPQSMSVVLLLEVDDKTHRRYTRRKRDQVVNRVCREAGLQIIHFKARWTYSSAIIGHIIEDRLRKVGRRKRASR